MYRTFIYIYNGLYSRLRGASSETSKKICLVHEPWESYYLFTFSRSQKHERPELNAFDLPYLFGYNTISAILWDPKLCTSRLSITRTKNKLKTPRYKLRPIHYYKTELLTKGKPNIFWKTHIDCHKWHTRISPRDTMVI